MNAFTHTDIDYLQVTHPLYAQRDMKPAIWEYQLSNLHHQQIKYKVNYMWQHSSFHGHKFIRHGVLDERWFRR